MSGLVKQIRTFPDIVKKSGEQILRTEGRSLAKELARQTLPIGLDDAAWKKLAFKISGDIRRAVMSPARLYNTLKESVSSEFAKEVWLVIQSGDKKRNRTLAKLLSSAPAVSSLPISSTVQEAWIKKVRIRGFGGVARRAKPQGIVTVEPAIAAFIKRKQRRIGMAKAGWAAAGRSISGRNVAGIPQWASYGRHKAPGSGIYIRASNRIRLINEVRHARKALPPNLEARAKQQAARNLELHLLHAANAILKKHFAKS